MLTFVLNCMYMRGVYSRHLCASHVISSYMQKSPCGLPGWYGTNRLLVYGDEFVKDYFCAGEHAVGVQEGVQEVDGEEAQVGQPLQQAFHAGVADLQHLAGVHHLTEADIHVITVQTGIRPKHVTQIVRRDLHYLQKPSAFQCEKKCLLDHLGHRDFRVLLKGVHHQPITTNIIYAL